MNYSHLKLYIVLIFLFTGIAGFSQSDWMVYFKDKKDNGFNPYIYFDQKAIERRIQNGLPLSDPSDWPVDETYIQQVSLLADDVFFTSRWFNCVAVSVSDDKILEILHLPFVRNIEMLEPTESKLASVSDYDTSISLYNQKVLVAQTDILGKSLWQQKGIDGKGLRIAIFDVGFQNADKVPFFDHIRADKRLIATRDFTKRGKSENVYYGNAHGTEVWSCIAGKLGDVQIGLATGAEFLLAKTEKNSEKFREELNWAQAAEWADQNGVDIINSSLGYTQKRYFNTEMDGKTSFVTRAANMAARKGMLVVNAAGNEGSGDWHTIGAPADADSALSIGGIDPETGYHTGFSSYGPTSDKRMKPNVSAFGHVIAAAPNGLTATQGTSFASPLVAGFAACAWQSNPALTNMQLFKEIEKSGNLYPYFDYAHGFGIPQAAYFVDKSNAEVKPTFSIQEADNVIKVIVNTELIRAKESAEIEDYEPEIFDAAHFKATPYFYYNIMNTKGVIDKYHVLDVTEAEVLTIYRSEFTDGETLNLHFAGYTQSIKL